LLLVPVAMIGLAFTNQLHGLVWTNQRHHLWTAGGVVGKGEAYVADGAQVTCDAVICFGDSGTGFLAHTAYS
jgi:hypothetical protein